MEEYLFYFEIFFIASFYPGKIIKEFFFKIKFSFVVEFHHRYGGGADLRYGSHIVYRFGGYRLGFVVGKTSVGFVVGDLTVFGYQYRCAGRRSFRDGIFGNGVDEGKFVGIQCQAGWIDGSQGCVADTRSVSEFRANSHRQFAFRRDLSLQQVDGYIVHDAVVFVACHEVFGIAPVFDGVGVSENEGNGVCFLLQLRNQVNGRLADVEIVGGGAAVTMNADHYFFILLFDRCHGGSIL